jgi:porphobilinogen synthase
MNNPYPNNLSLFPPFPISRPRRLRFSPTLRDMLRETTLTPKNLIMPFFVHHAANFRQEISSMPGQYQCSVDKLIPELKEIAALGIPAVILFGIPAEKDPLGLDNFSPQGVIQRAIKMIKSTVPQLIIITDVCLCEYTDHGHCGLLNIGENQQTSLPEGYVLNDATLDILKKVAISHAQAGADMLAPSGMIDGMVAAIRMALNETGFDHLPILSYAVKYASSFYAPFREAAQGAPKFGDRKSHQMDPANRGEALREAALDVSEGADILMVKPALPYLDIIRDVKNTFPEIPLAAFNVSGEYAMLKAASANGWLDEKNAILETLTAIKRAGADLIISYHTKEAAKILNT